MAKKLKWSLVERAIRHHDLRVFSPQDIRHLLRGSEVSVRFLLTRAVKRGDVLKLRRGLYALPDKLPSELEVANALIAPSYISLQYALAYYQIIPEAVFEITSVTTRTTRHFDALGKTYSYRHIKPQLFTGYLPRRVHEKTIWIAEPEKALVDSLYFESLGLLSIPDRLDLSKIEPLKMEKWSVLFDRRRFIEKVDRILAKLE